MDFVKIVRDGLQEANIFLGLIFRSNVFLKKNNDFLIAVVMLFYFQINFYSVFIECLLYYLLGGLRGQVDGVFKVEVHEGDLNTLLPSA